MFVGCTDLLLCTAWWCGFEASYCMYKMWEGRTDQGACLGYQCMGFGIYICKYILALQEVELEWTPSQCNAVEITQCVLSTRVVVGHQCHLELQQVPCTLSCAARVCVRRQSMLSAVSGAWQFDTALKPSDT